MPVCLSLHPGEPSQDVLGERWPCSLPIADGEIQSRGTGDHCKQQHEPKEDTGLEPGRERDA